MTLKVHASLFFLTSTALQVMFVFPIGNSDPDGGKHMTSRSLPSVSMANGSFHTTIAVDLLGSVDFIRLAGQTGSTAVTF